MSNIINALSLKRNRIHRSVSLVVALLVGGNGWAAAIAADSTHGAGELIVVVGAGGEPAYSQQFQIWASRWIDAAQQHGIPTVLIDGSEPAATCLEQLRAALSDRTSTSGDRPLWLVLIGHGTFDGKVAKFNLPGPDLSAADLKVLLDSIPGECIVINCASASGPFINELFRDGRIVVTATKSGYEYSFSRFGDYLSRAVAAAATADLQFDLDKDGQVSLLELVLAASRHTAEFYESENRLATEHALLNDNHDGLGTPLEWFRGVRAVRQAKTGTPTDGLRANQLFLFTNPERQSLPSEKIVDRDALEYELERLRARKDRMAESDYYRELETIALQLLEIYRD